MRYDEVLKHLDKDISPSVAAHLPYTVERYEIDKTHPLYDPMAYLGNEVKDVPFVRVLYRLQAYTLGKHISHYRYERVS